VQVKYNGEYIDLCGKSSKICDQDDFEKFLGESIFESDMEFNDICFPG